MKGQCLCGAVTFDARGPILGASICHCGQCRRQSGYAWSGANVAAGALVVTGEVTWFAASDHARRGFCARCGSALFWQGTGKHDIAFSLGAVEGPTGLRVTRHIFTADKGDYYDLPANAEAS